MSSLVYSDARSDAAGAAVSAQELEDLKTLKLLVQQNIVDIERSIRLSTDDNVLYYLKRALTDLEAALAHIGLLLRTDGTVGDV
jgi:hypothetical protein